ncbi:MAG TPA: hypothetical protein VG291_05265 [Xanthobacteraceae bacterium]|jgi:hypothetical protein|nr:hypothetical protein [Xanthobacteraceae bacterium]
MKQAAVAGAIMLTLAGLGPWRPAVAQNAGVAPNATAVQPGDTAPRPRARPPARIRVRPLVHPLAQSTPGPDAVRQCSFQLAPEYRPSGTVIVPQMHCWWERG